MPKLKLWAIVFLLLFTSALVLPSAANAGSCRCQAEGKILGINNTLNSATCDPNKNSQKDCDDLMISWSDKSFNLGYECHFFPSDNCLEDLQCQCHVVEHLNSKAGPIINDATFVKGYRDITNEIHNAVFLNADESKTNFKMGFYDSLSLQASQTVNNTPDNLCSGPVEYAIQILGPNGDGSKEYWTSVDQIDCVPYTPDAEVKPRDIVPPSPVIKIPGLEFSPTINYDAAGFAYIPWLAEYILAIYNFGIAMASVIAVVLIVIQGIRIVVSAGGEQKKAAYQTITRVIIGLVIAWSSYAILYTINPDLVKLKYLKIKNVTQEDLTTDAEQDISGATVSTGAQVVPEGENLAGSDNAKVSSEILDKLKLVAQELKIQGNGVSLYITDGFRDPQVQLNLIKENCQNPAGSDTCKPKMGKSPTCIMKGNPPNPANCPHTTGRAVDAWGFQNGQQCGGGKRNCKTDKATDPCRTSCQADVIAAMKKAGFCNLNTEAWHFELPRMSSGCE